MALTSIPLDVRARLETTYTIAADPRTSRCVVSLIAGYGEDDGVETPEAAAAACLDLARDEGAAGTHWYVFDRITGTMHVLEQGEFDPLMRSE